MRSHLDFVRSRTEEKRTPNMITLWLPPKFRGFERLRKCRDDCRSTKIECLKHDNVVTACLSILGGSEDEVDDDTGAWLWLQVIYHEVALNWLWWTNMPADSKPDRAPRAAFYTYARANGWAHSAEREARSQVRESEQAREERMDDAQTVGMQSTLGPK